MKKLLCIFCCLALLATTGCKVFKKENKPEDVGKNYIEEKFAGNEFDTSGLEYAVLEQTDKPLAKWAPPISRTKNRVEKTSVSMDRFTPFIPVASHWGIRARFL